MTRITKATLVVLILGFFTSFNAHAWNKCYKAGFADLSHLTITDAVVATEDLSILKDLVVGADLAGLLADNEQFFTVFAPVNSAFENLLAGLAPTDETVLETLTYHVKPGYFDPRRTWYIREVTTANPDGQTLFVKRTRNNVQINQSTLVDCQGIRLSNGIVFLIDSVLLPQQ